MSPLTVKPLIRVLTTCLLLAFLLTACRPAVTELPPQVETALAVETQIAAETQAATETQIAAASPSAGVEMRAQPPTPAPSPTPSDILVWLPPELPAALRESINLPPGFAPVDQSAGAALQIDVMTGQQPAESGSVDWVYALVAPFPTVADEISLADLKSAWTGSDPDGLPFNDLLVDESTLAIFEKLWGPAGSRVRPAESSRLLDWAWRARDAWAIVPFEQLEPRWKVIAVDGQSPVQKAFDPDAYPLTVTFSLQGEPDVLAQAVLDQPLAPSNRQADRLTTLMLTGVTALVRGTASYMEVFGMTYPAEFIGPWLQEADILHISNEIPFAKNCPQPFDWVGLVFCSQTEYIELLEHVGADVIELTGDHFADWGPEAMLYTLELYKERGWPYYGGGANIEEARKPALLEHNGNKIAFLGCNGKPPGYATASETTPGAAHCDMELMAAEIKKLREDGYLPVVTFQHLEYYQYVALPQLQQDFQQAADAGAVLVSGSQAHQPHAFEFRDGSFLHYGLGNLFFDQTNQGEPPRTAFIDRHVIYDGRHISTELLTIYLIDYARSRPMTPEERQQLLQTVFEASGW